MVLTSVDSHDGIVSDKGRNQGRAGGRRHGPDEDEGYPDECVQESGGKLGSSYLAFHLGERAHVFFAIGLLRLNLTVPSVRKPTGRRPKDPTRAAYRGMSRLGLFGGIPFG